MEVENEKKREMLWCVPKSYKKFLSQYYDLCHGLYVTGLNSYMNDGYIKAYFKQWGSVTSCKVKKVPNCVDATACVKFSAEHEADLANWSGPHIIGGLEVEIRQFVHPKTGEDIDDEKAAATEKPRASRSMGLGYILEDPQWLDKQENERETAAIKQWNN